MKHTIKSKYLFLVYQTLYYIYICIRIITHTTAYEYSEYFCKCLLTTQYTLKVLNEKIKNYATKSI